MSTRVGVQCGALLKKPRGALTVTVCMQDPQVPCGKEEIQGDAPSI